MSESVERLEKPLKGLAVGRMVHYIEEPLLSTESEGHVQAGEMKHRAAVIEEVLDQEEGLCLLLVMAPGNLREMKSRFLDPTSLKSMTPDAIMVGTWHWPERV